MLQKIRGEKPTLGDFLSLSRAWRDKFWCKRKGKKYIFNHLWLSTLSGWYYQVHWDSQVTWRRQTFGKQWPQGKSGSLRVTSKALHRTASAHLFGLLSWHSAWKHQPQQHKKLKWLFTPPSAQPLSPADSYSMVFSILAPSWVRYHYSGTGSCLTHTYTPVIALTSPC